MVGQGSIGNYGYANKYQQNNTISKLPKLQKASLYKGLASQPQLYQVRSPES
jgi:hypothetical protein